MVNKKLKLDVVIGNPPCQEEVKGISDKWIFPYFMDQAYKVGEKVELITPAKFLSNAGVNTDLELSETTGSEMYLFTSLSAVLYVVPCNPSCDVIYQKF